MKPLVICLVFILLLSHTEVTMSQGLSDQQMRLFSSYQHETRLESGMVFYILLTGIEAHQTEFAAADYAVLKDESLQLLASQNQHRQTLMYQAAKDLIGDTAIANLNVSEFAQGMADVYIKLEANEANQNKQSLQRSLDKLSVAGQALLQQKVIPPDMEQGSHTRTDWQLMADEAPELLHGLFAQMLSELARQGS